jgi:hypothetical protein
MSLELAYMALAVPWLLLYWLVAKLARLPNLPPMGPTPAGRILKPKSSVPQPPIPSSKGNHSLRDFNFVPATLSDNTG